MLSKVLGKKQHTLFPVTLSVFGARLREDFVERVVERRLCAATRRLLLLDLCAGMQSDDH